MKLLFHSIFVLLFINLGQALALPSRTVYSQDAQGIKSAGVDLKVWSGYGLTINFIPSGEIIEYVWIADPSRIGFTSNGNLCRKSESNTNCMNSGATVLFIRQIKPIDFPDLTSSQDGSTQMTVITKSVQGQKQYQFRLIPEKGMPSYTSLIVKPDSEKPKPLLLSKLQYDASPNSSLIQISRTEPNNVIQTRQATFFRNASFQRNDANAIAYGLSVAVQQGHIKPKSSTWYKIQDAIHLLRLGKSRQEAVSLSGISMFIFNKLIQLGLSSQ